MIKCALQYGDPHQIELGFEKCWFVRTGGGGGGEGTRVPGEKPSSNWTRTNNKFNPHMMMSPGIKPGPQVVGGKCCHHCAIPRH